MGITLNIKNEHGESLENINVCGATELREEIIPACEKYNLVMLKVAANYGLSIEKPDNSWADLLEDPNETVYEALLREVNIIINLYKKKNDHKYDICVVWWERLHQKLKEFPIPNFKLYLG